MAEVPAQAKPATAPAIGSKPPGQTIPGSISAKPTDPSKKTGSVQVKAAPFRIEPLQASDPWIKELIYGVHGSGKTLLAGTAADVPEMQDVLLINAEGGSNTIKDSDLIQHKEKITVARVTEYKQVAHIHDFLKMHCALRDKDNIAELRRTESFLTGIPVDQIETPHKYRTVIIDSLTEVEQYSTYSILGINQDDLLQEDMAVAGWPEFRKNLESVKLLVRAFRDLPIHVIMTCAITYKQDEKKRFHYQPLLTGQLSRSVQGFVDIVGFLVADQPKPDEDAPRRLFVQPIQISEGKFDAKNRKSAFKGSWFDNPTQEMILKETGMIPS